MKYKISFIENSFRFIRDGSITITDDSVILTGRKIRSKVAQIIIFVVTVPLFSYLGMLLLGFLPGFFIGVILGFVASRRMSESPGSLAIGKSNITAHARNGALLAFKSWNIEKGKLQTTSFEVDTVENAVRLADQLLPNRGE